MMGRKPGTEGVREDESDDDEDDEMPCVIRGKSEGDCISRGGMENIQIGGEDNLQPRVVLYTKKCVWLQLF